MTDSKTERLYYDDSYTTSFTARIIDRIDHEGVIAVALDRTYFYPTGGGQPNDTGMINDIPVLDVFSRDERVYHVLAEPIEGDTVNAQVDWARRFDHMQQHTGQHILSQAFMQAADANTVGFHLSSDSLTVDLDKLNIDSYTLIDVEELANRIVWENHPITTTIIDPADAEKFGVRMRKMPEQMTTAGLRVVSIGEFDVTACGGTHVSGSGSVGIIKIMRADKKGDKLRIEFVCGGRALREFRERSAIVNRLAADLTCGYSEIPDTVGRLREDVQAVGRSLKAATQQLIGYEAQALIAETQPQGGRRVIARVFENRPIDEVRYLASALIATPGTIALLGASGEKAQLIFARSADLSNDMNGTLKLALQSFGGRGGGQPSMAQGGGVSASAEQIRGALDAAQTALK